MSWDRFLALSWKERMVMNDELNIIIQRTDAAGSPRPKDMR
jgi:hypothetical protein